MAEDDELKDDFVAEVESCYRRGRDQSSSFRKEAREAFAMVASDQWEDADLALMAKQKRQPVTINRIAPIIEAVCGQEANGRHETSFKPRGLEDSGLSETLHAVDRWSAQECDAEHEEAEAFRDTLICGMGWTEDRMDFELDPEGMWVRERRDPLEMYWDPAAKKKNLTDSRWMICKMRGDQKALEMRFPDLPDQADGELWLDAPDDEEEHDADPPFYERGLDSGHKFGTITMVVYQWYEVETSLTFVAAGQKHSWSTADVEAKGLTFAKLQDRFKKAGIPYAKQVKRVYYSALLARGAVLEKKRLGYDGFTFHCITGRRDRNKNCFYGMVRDMKDPQRWANVVFSSMLRIMQKNSKGGVMAELGAFADPKKAQEQWASPDEVVLLNNGALSNKRVQVRPPADYPSSMDKLLAFAVSSMRDVSGVNVELLGAADRDQPGIVEVQRKQSALAILAPFFDALRSYRKASGRCKLAFIRLYFTDNTIIRVAGPKAQAYLPLIRNPDGLRFDVEVDESPLSRNAKEQTFAVLQTALPAMMKMGIPIPPDLIRYMPIPVELQEAWLQYIEQQSKDPQRQMRQQLEIEGMQADNAKGFSQAQANQARAQAAMKQDPQLDAQIRIAEAKFDLFAEMQRLQMEAKQMGLELQFKAAEHQMDMQHQVAEHAMQARRDDQQHQQAMMHGEQDHQQSMAINEQAGEAKVQQIKAQAAAKPANGAAE